MCKGIVMHWSLLLVCSVMTVVCPKTSFCSPVLSISCTRWILRSSPHGAQDFEASSE